MKQLLIHFFDHQFRISNTPQFAIVNSKRRTWQKNAFPKSISLIYLVFMANGSQMYLLFDSLLSDMCCNQSWILSRSDRITYTLRKIEHWYYSLLDCLSETGIRWEIRFGNDWQDVGKLVTENEWLLYL